MRHAALVVAAAVALSGCKQRGAKKIARDPDARAVVVVDSPADGVELRDEVEPNGEIAEATPLLAGPGLAPGARAGARGALDGEKDVDLYALQVAEAGILRAQVSGIDGVDLILDVRDADGAVLVRSDRGPALVIEGVPNLTVEPGTYYVGVTEFVKKRKRRRKRPKNAVPAEEGRTGPSPGYELTVALAREAPGFEEREPNPDPDTAGDLLLGDERLGWAGWYRDVDAWRIPVEGFTSQYALDLDVEGVPGVTLSLRVLDPARARVLERKGRKGGGLAVRNLIPVPDEGDPDEADAGPEPPPARDGADAGADDGRYYYAVLSARRSNPLDKYRIRATTRLVEPGEEVEPNDTPAGAATLEPGDDGDDAGELSGFVTPGDADCYLYTAGEASLLDVTVTPAGDLDVRLEVVGTDGASLAESKAGKRGDAESVTGVRVAAGTGVVLRVTGRVAGASTYKLSWTVVPDDGAGADPGLLEGEYD